MGRRLIRYDAQAPTLAAGGVTAFDGGAWVALEDEAGRVGWGELVARPGFSAPLASLRDELDGALALIDSVALDDAEGWLAARGGGWSSPVRFAVECASCDLIAQREGRPLAMLLGATPGAELEVPVNAAVATAAQAAERVGAGYRTVKLKCRGLSAEQAVARARQTREAVGPDVALRLDANRAYDLDQAERLLGGLVPLAIEYVEEPAAALSLAGWRRLAGFGVPLALDETLLEPQRALELLEVGAATVCVVKPAFVGGLLAARALCQRLAARGAEVVLTGALESAVGVAAVAHLAVALRLERACGLGVGHGEPGWLAPTAGVITLQAGAGLQAAPDFKQGELA